MEIFEHLVCVKEIKFPHDDDYTIYKEGDQLWIGYIDEWTNKNISIESIREHFISFNEYRKRKIKELIKELI